MPLDLCDYRQKTQGAVKAFWGNRELARHKQSLSGRLDQGERSGVTAGKNMDGFIDLVLAVIAKNGLGKAQIHRRHAMLTLPGYFRPTKKWDLLVTYRHELIAVIELKSHVGPSFGNNFNNRAEEAIGTAVDLWTTYREGGFGMQPRPFVGWLMLVEDAPGSRSPVKDRSPHFPIAVDFQDSSYLARYNILCQKLVQENLYSCATVIASKRTASKTGSFIELSAMTGMKAFVTFLAGHIAATAARHG